MGHERVGTLPRSKNWRSVVRQISEYSPEMASSVEGIAEQTIKNVRSKFVNIEHDGGVHAAFKFLVLLAYSSKLNDPNNFLHTQGIDLPGNVTPLQIAKTLNGWVEKQSESNEYAAFAKSAAIDAIADWYQKNKVTQADLFHQEKDPLAVWRKAADGAGFCELSRSYFSHFTERYLKYFLEREASSQINSVAEREAFSKQLGQHIESISTHAFETSKITQSFAAGWFNKNAKDQPPSDRKVNGFLTKAFGKMRAELLREEEKR